MLILSVSPLILFIFLVFFKKVKLVWASLFSLLTTFLLVIFIWKINLPIVTASFLKGTFIATDIFLIVFGALFFLETLKKANIINHLCIYLEKISPDYRIQVIILAWFFLSFLEGTSGFGTPSAIVAPLLIGLGLSPILSVAISLLGNSTAGIFGAAGTPIRVGFAGLDITNVPIYSALINIIGFIVPVFILWASTSSQKNRKEQFFEALPFAIFSGFAFVIPSVFVVFLGQEFPSIIGAVIGFIIVLFALKFNLFVPKTIRSLRQKELEVYTPPPLKVFFPYILLIFLLILGKIFFSGVGFTLDFGLKHTFSLFNPGLIFIISSVLTNIFYRKHKNFDLKIIKNSALKSVEPFLVITLISIMVQLMINSNQNSSGNFSFLQIIANNLKTPLLPFLAPFIGAFGSFLTGSVTVSNIMFGSILESTSRVLGINSSIILSLELIGGAAGNMIALADILPALAVVSLQGQVREVLKRVIIPCSIYVILVGIIGLLIT